jgi:hypothetical protein
MSRMKTILALTFAAAAAGTFQLLQRSPAAATRAAARAPHVTLTTLSTDQTRATGGDVLMQVQVIDGPGTSALRVRANGRDITSAFHPSDSANTRVGLVTDLKNGSNSISADVGNASAAINVVNYPITGPVISGPQQQPFICQTDKFVLPDGSTLGPALDANCSARTVVQYVYKPTSPADPAKPFKPMPNPTTLPPDVAKTTTTTGATVNFIVRVETGTMNRGVYQNAILHDPTLDPPPSPFAPPKGWNRRLIAIHGAGCPGGWYIQGAAQGANLLDADRLGQGYALFINTLNHPTNSCNAFLAGETTMMGKEHFIETFGVPLYTMSTGNSGGAYTSLQIADAFPGLIDGVLVGATFPDALSIALSGLDAHLLLHYFTKVSPAGFTAQQQVDVSGYEGMKAFVDAANQAQRTDPVPDRADNEGYLSARWNQAVPATMRYDPVRNPKGARPTVFDAAKNVYGVNPATGAALRPYDNTGVQYGLKALNSGAITVQQFLELNARIGGFDQDANYVPARAVGDSGAIRRAYEFGLTLGANGGLTSIPIVDNASSNETGGYHYGWFHFAVRERLRKAAGGRSENMVMWRSTKGNALRDLFDTWMVAYRTDTSTAPQIEKVLKARPAGAVEGCYSAATPPAFIAEPLVFTRESTTRCSTQYPVYANPRYQAGGPLSADVLKCQLKPIDPKDYAVTFTASDMAKLKATFPEGVCDWSKPGVNQVPVRPWASLGPSGTNSTN